jgi:hypothetical protein
MQLLTKNQCPQMKTFLFGRILNKGSAFAHSEPVGRMGAVRNDSRKPFNKDDKRAAIKLCKTQVPLRNIRAQLKRSESTRRRILVFVKANPFDPIVPINRIAPIISIPNRDGGMIRLVLTCILCNSNKIYVF